MGLRITGGRVIDPAQGLDALRDVYVAQGRVAALGDAPAGFSVDEEIDARGRIVCPGLVDLCARLREPGEEHKASIASETRAAAAAGVTTLCCPPDTHPVIDTPAMAQLIHQRALAAGYARVATLGALTRGLDGQHLSEMAALKDAGCVGVATALRPIANPVVLRRAMEYAATFGLTVFLYAQDARLGEGGCAHEGAIATRLGLPGIPSAAETVAVARDIALVEQTGVSAHFCRLSTAAAVRMVARARFDGLPVTADVSAHHLFLTESALADFDSDCHVLPPLRTEDDRAGLRHGLAEGTITAVCSDHSPHEPDAKLNSFGATQPGMSSLETFLPLVLRLVEEGAIDLLTALDRVTRGPARILGLELGALAPGAGADICVLDPEQRWTPSPDTLLSRGHNTPFVGQEMKGRVTHTVYGGRVVYQEVQS